MSEDITKTGQKKRRLGKTTLSHLEKYVSNLSEINVENMCITVSSSVAGVVDSFLGLYDVDIREKDVMRIINEWKDIGYKIKTTDEVYKKDDWTEPVSIPKVPKTSTYDPWKSHGRVKGRKKVLLSEKEVIRKEWLEKKKIKEANKEKQLASVQMLNSLEESGSLKDKKHDYEEKKPAEEEPVTNETEQFKEKSLMNIILGFDYRNMSIGVLTEKINDKYDMGATVTEISKETSNIFKGGRRSDLEDYMIFEYDGKVTGKLLKLSEIAEKINKKYHMDISFREITRRLVKKRAWFSDFEYKKREKKVVEDKEDDPLIKISDEEITKEFEPGTYVNRTEFYEHLSDKHPDETIDWVHFKSQLKKANIRKSSYDTHLTIREKKDNAIRELDRIEFFEVFDERRHKNMVAFYSKITETFPERNIAISRFEKMCKEYGVVKLGPGYLVREGKAREYFDKMMHGEDLGFESNTGNKKTLRVEDLTLAIKYSVDREGMKDEVAKRMANHIMNFFGYSDRIIDNILEQEDRDLFYILEDAGLLGTEREETTLYDGREWRIHYWLLRKKHIFNLIGEKACEPSSEKGIYDILMEEGSSGNDKWVESLREIGQNSNNS